MAKGSASQYPKAGLQVEEPCILGPQESFSFRSAHPQLLFSIQHDRKKLSVGHWLSYPLNRAAQLAQVFWFPSLVGWIRSPFLSHQLWGVGRQLGHDTFFPVALSTATRWTRDLWESECLRRRSGVLNSYKGCSLYIESTTLEEVLN